MNTRPQLIEIEELVLSGNPRLASIEAAVFRALRDAGLTDATMKQNAVWRVAGEMARSVVARTRSAEGS